MRLYKIIDGRAGFKFKFNTKIVLFNYIIIKIDDLCWPRLFVVRELLVYVWPAQLGL